MPPKKIAQEVEFLKNFQKRFKSLIDYRAALSDLFREGLITATAYDEAMKPIQVKTVAEILEDTCAGRRTVKTKASKMPKPPKEYVTDPCHGGSYNRNPC